MTPRLLIPLIVAAALLFLSSSSAFAMLHPQQGRFMQRDPLGYVDGMACYVYVKDEPITLRDPNGLSSADWTYLSTHTSKSEHIYDELGAREIGRFGIVAGHVQDYPSTERSCPKKNERKAIFNYDLNVSMYLAAAKYEPFLGYYKWRGDVKAHERRTHWALWLHGFYPAVEKQLDKYDGKKIRRCDCEKIVECILTKLEAFTNQARAYSDQFDNYGGPLDTEGYDRHTLKDAGITFDILDCFPR